MIGAVRRAAATLLKAGLATQELSEVLTNVVSTKRDAGELSELAAIEELDTALKKCESSDLTAEERIVYRLVDVAWMSLFPYYYWLSEGKK